MGAFTATPPGLTAGEVMDRAAVLMNDPAKTDYNYTTLVPMVNMALDDLKLHLVDNQSGVVMHNIVPMLIPAYTIVLWPPNYEPGGPGVPLPPGQLRYPSTIVEVQEIVERRVGGSDDEFVLMKRCEYHPLHEPRPTLGSWAWEDRAIKFGHKGASADREIRIKSLYFAEFINAVDKDSVIGMVDHRPYLSFKTAAYAAMFIGENPERAGILNAQAEDAIDKMLSIQNKGRQNIMTRHRPFRAAWKARGGY